MYYHQYQYKYTYITKSHNISYKYNKYSFLILRIINNVIKKFYILKNLNLRISIGQAALYRI